MSIYVTLESLESPPQGSSMHTTETKALQGQNQNLPSIPRSTFRRLVKGYAGPEFNVSGTAIEVLQSASEGHVTTIMEKAATVAAYGARSTVYANDLVLVQQLCGSPRV